MAVLLRRLIIPLVGAAALFVAGTEYLSLRVLDHHDATTSIERLQVRQPWGGLAAQELARGMYGNPGLDPQLAAPVFAWQLPRAPLNPWRWLDRAELAFEAGDDWARVLWHLDAAIAIQPQNRNLRWEAMEFSRRTRHFAVAEENLRHWLRDNPHGTGRALRAAAGWIPDPEARVARILPAEEPFLEAALELARREKDFQTGVFIWERLARPRPANNRALLDFADLAMGSGHPRIAAQAWAESFQDFAYGSVPNADFRHPISTGRGLHWDTRTPVGVTTTRDHEHFVTEPASLRIHFDGNENPRLTRPLVRIPVDPAFTRWRLTGYWRGEALTTRSLPYIQVTAGRGAHARADIPGSSFGWTPFSLEVDVPEGKNLLTLEIRRDAPSIEFDRYIGGRLWLDALRLERIENTESTTDSQDAQ